MMEVEAGTVNGEEYRKKSGKWRFPLALVLVCLVGFGIGAGGFWIYNHFAHAPAESNPAVAENSAPTTPVAGTEKATVTCPLCGLPLEKLPASRPWAVMIDNAAAARPPHGLEEAEMVFECPVEGGMTRLMAVYYHQKPGRIGPVRSIRPYFLDLAQGIGAVATHCGGSPEALRRIREQRLPDIDEISNPAYFSRNPAQAEPHNLYTTGELLQKASQDRKLNKELALENWRFAQTADFWAAVTDEAKVLSIQYGRLAEEVKYVFDPSRAAYLRYNGGQAHLDAESGRQLAAANIVVLQMTGRVTDSAGRLQINTTGKGKALVLSQGKKIEATWSKSSAANDLLLMDITGKKVSLAPGLTWIQVVLPTNKVE